MRYSKLRCLGKALYYPSGICIGSALRAMLNDDTQGSHQDGLPTVNGW